MTLRRLPGQSLGPSLFCAGLVCALPAFADPPKDHARAEQAAKDGKGADQAVQSDEPAPKSGAKAKAIRLEEISVEGRIQKPQAFYILPRSSLNYSALDQQESLLPKITKALKASPF